MSEKDEKVNVEEESVEEKSWSEEFTVASSQVIDMVKKLVQEASVRRIVVKNETYDFNLEIPIVLGVAGIAMLPAYAGLALLAAVVTDCQIMVERMETEDEVVIKTEPATE